MLADEVVVAAQDASVDGGADALQGLVDEDEEAGEGDLIVGEQKALHVVLLGHAPDGLDGVEAAGVGALLERPKVEVGYGEALTAAVGWMAVVD